MATSGERRQGSGSRTSGTSDPYRDARSCKLRCKVEKRELGQDESELPPAPEVPSQPHSSLLLLSDLTWEREGPKERERTPGFVEEASRCALSCKDGAGSEERTLLTAKTSSHTASSLLPRGFVKVALGSARLADP